MTVTLLKVLDNKTELLIFNDWIDTELRRSCVCL